jgi:hypothetical protein
MSLHISIAQINCYDNAQMMIQNQITIPEPEQKFAQTANPTEGQCQRTSVCFVFSKTNSSHTQNCRVSILRWFQQRTGIGHDEHEDVPRDHGACKRKQIGK